MMKGRRADEQGRSPLVVLALFLTLSALVAAAVVLLLSPRALGETYFGGSLFQSTGVLPAVDSISSDARNKVSSSSGQWSIYSSGEFGKLTACPPPPKVVYPTTTIAAWPAPAPCQAPEIAVPTVDEQQLQFFSSDADDTLSDALTVQEHPTGVLLFVRYNNYFDANVEFGKGAFFTQSPDPPAGAPTITSTVPAPWLEQDGRFHAEVVTGSMPLLSGKSLTFHLARVIDVRNKRLWFLQLGCSAACMERNSVLVADIFTNWKAER